MPRLSKIGAAALAAFGWTSGGASVTATYLVVAGGGGGGSLRGGGGGAGGYLSGTASLNPTLTYTVTVGAGGTGGAGGSGAANPGASGTGSVFSVYSTAGGGGGGQNVGVGLSGGSGGGGGFQANGGTGNTPSTSPAQGTNGGAGATTAPPTRGGGGGGATSAGATGDASGNGGNGTASSISGSSVTYAGGGGGGGQYSAGGAGTGGTGGGGAGSATADGTAGTIGLGGGGGGSGYPASTVSGTGGNGGSGVVIISYAGAQQFSGGVVTSVGGNTIHTFTTSGTLGPITTLSASYLIVAGGGGGGVYCGGGGGAGGVLSGSGLTIDPNSTYLVTVGAGGASVAYGTASNSGSNSSFSMVATAAVGGGRGSYGGGNTTNSAASGGSGGGGGSTAGQTTGGAGTSGQGYAGGNSPGATGNYSSGGGGGAGGVGSDGVAAGNGGAGGVGIASSISGTSTYYAGGGGGGSYSGSGGAGGNGGGGAGGSTPVSGTANTGGGGGGNVGGSGPAGSAGGSGVVIISYPGSTQQMAGGTVTIVGGNVIHTFTSTGYLAPIKYVSNSLRFRSSASAYLNRTMTTPTNNKIWTWSGWIKRGTLVNGSTQRLFSANGLDSIFFGSYDATEGYLAIYLNSASSGQLITTARYRDPAAWYHFVIAFDTTQATAANRVKIYVNGVQVTAFSTATYPSQNYNTAINSAVSHTIGNFVSANYFNGYMAEVNFIDGQALTPNSFGTFNSYGVWQPITYGGSYGTNGFYLPMTPSTSTYAGLVSNSDYLTAPSNAAFAVGTSDFTMETWFYPTSASQTGQFFYVPSGGIQMGYLNASNWGLCHANVVWQTTTGTLPTTNAWNHMAITRSGTTVGLFLNGVRLVTGTIGTNYSQNTCVIGQGIIGYMSNSRFVKGTAVYSPSDATYTVPTAPLTNITNTSLLTFQNSTNIDNSSNGFTLTATGTVRDLIAYPFNLNQIKDYSPQNNNWTANNIQPVAGVSMDVMTDVPTLTSATAANYCTLNPLFPSSGTTLSNGNLDRSAGSAYGSIGTLGVTTGKWYWEATIGSSNGANNLIGIAAISSGITPQQWYGTAYGWAYFGNTGNKFNNGSGSAYGATFTSGDVIGVALDLDNGTLTFYKNNTSQGTAFTGLNTGATYAPSFDSNLVSTVTVTANFGQRPFSYTPPTGFVALNTYNL